jgi:hypothetical protein
MKTGRPMFYIFALILLGCTGLMGTCVFDGGVEGDGNVVKESRAVEGFTALQAGSAFEVFLLQGEEESLTIEADQNLMQYIVTEVKNGQLRLYSTENIRKAEKLNVYISFRSLEAISVSGAVDLQGVPGMHFGELLLEGSGASRMLLDMEASSLRANVSGASTLELSGQAGKAVFEISGASRLNAGDLLVSDCRLEASGASHAGIHVADKLLAEVSGASSVKYRGSPAVAKDVSGAGSLKAWREEE